MSNHAVESTKVTAPDNVRLHTRFFKPTATGVASSGNNLGIVWVDHYTVLGGCQGLLGGIASGLAVKGYKAAAFDKRGARKSTGRHSLTGFAEVKDVVAVWQWVCENAGVERMLLVGSSAGNLRLMEETKMEALSFSITGEPIAGSSVDQIEWVVGYVNIGWVHQLKKPKKQLSSAVGLVEMRLIEGAGHFQVEGPGYDNQMVKLILEFASSL